MTARGPLVWLTAVLGGGLVAALGAGLLHSGMVGLLVLWLLAGGWIASAPRKGIAMRRLLLLLGLLVLTGAAMAWQALTAGPPAQLPATRAAAENAPGLSLFVVLGQLMLAGTVPFVLAGLGAVLLALAWLVGREPRLRRVPHSEMTVPRR